jgi:hypothetical protein
MTDAGQRWTVVPSPNKPRPADPLIREIAALLAAIERNYGSEGSGPGSRFEGCLLEDAQAVAVVRHVLWARERAGRVERPVLPAEQARALETVACRPYHIPGCPARDAALPLDSCDCPESYRRAPYSHPAWPCP